MSDDRVLHGVIDQDENQLKGKITIPGLVNYGTVNTPEMLYNTVTGWNAQPQLKSKNKTIYVYTDYEIDGNGNPVEAIKIGDGNAYLIDLPFHTTVTLSEKQFWDNKVRVYIDPLNSENLIFTTN